jgi:hypothetical protein
MPRSSALTEALTREEMDALVEAHYRSEIDGDVDAIVEGFIPGAEHDVVGKPGGPVYGGAAIAAYYRRLLTDLRISCFQPVPRRYGDNHVVDESLLGQLA